MAGQGTYPEWAPEIFRLSTTPKRDWEEILFSHPDMEMVWNSLRRRESKSTDPEPLPELWACEFHQAVQAALSCRHSRFTTNQAREINRRAAKKARQLAEELHDTDWGHDVALSLFPHRAEYLTLAMSYNRHGEIDPQVLETITKALETSVIDLVEALAARLESNVVQRLLSKPNDVNACRVYFIRMLSSYMQRAYGSPLHDIVAATTRALFNVEINGAWVSQLTKNTRDSGSKSRKIPNIP